MHSPISKYTPHLDDALTVPGNAFSNFRTSNQVALQDINFYVVQLIAQLPTESPKMKPGWLHHHHFAMFSLNCHYNKLSSVNGIMIEEQNAFRYDIVPYRTRYKLTPKRGQQNSQGKGTLDYLSRLATALSTMQLTI
ncbi:hypothetical protein TNCV_2989221 [Trichonephila clavipes]|nr:hypothetical protein TNCV_2989221 [Trichonephila clavipes]